MNREKDTSYNDKLKLIFLLKEYIKRKIHLEIISRIYNLSKLSSGNKEYNHISLSKTNQWSEVLTYFKEKYSHFETFEIKLPHTKGNPVKGVGDKRSVIDFYDQISQLNIFSKINTQSRLLKLNDFLLVL